MSKLLLTAVSFLLAGTVYAAHASCEITKQTKKGSASAKVDANFGKTQVATLQDGKTVEFTLTSTMVNPDSSYEYIVINPFTESQCTSQYGSDGVATTCKNKKSQVTISCTYYPYGS